jgi:hypothetical protein
VVLFILDLICFRACLWCLFLQGKQQNTLSLLPATLLLHVGQAERFEISDTLVFSVD